MTQFDGVDLGKALANATQAVTKDAEKKVTNLIEGLLRKRHDQQVKAVRLAQESEQAKAAAEAITAQIDKIKAGDWSAIDEFELGGKGTDTSK